MNEFNLIFSIENSPYATQYSRFRMIRPILQQQPCNVQMTARTSLMQGCISGIVFLVRIHIQSFQTECNHVNVTETSRLVQNRFADTLVQHPAANLTIDVILVLLL